MACEKGFHVQIRMFVMKREIERRKRKKKKMEDEAERDMQPVEFELEDE